MSLEWKSKEKTQQAKKTIIECVFLFFFVSALYWQINEMVYTGSMDVK